MVPLKRDIEAIDFFLGFRKFDVAASGSSSSQLPTLRAFRSRRRLAEVRRLQHVFVCSLESSLLWQMSENQSEDA